MSRTALIAIGFLLVSLVVTDGQTIRKRDIPLRLDPTRVPKTDSNTLLLWRFEEALAKDKTVLKNNGKALGRAALADVGRHGKALKLNGGGDGVRISSIQGLGEAYLTSEEANLTIDFWVRLDDAPSARQCLFDSATTTSGPAVRLELDPRRRLLLSGADLPDAESELPLPLGEWAHLAITQRRTYQPNRVYEDKLGIEVLLNGYPWVRTYANEDSSQYPANYRFPPRNMVGVMVLGNTLNLKAGFRGLIDEFRVSNAARDYCRLGKQDWLDGNQTRSNRRTMDHFRSPDGQIFHATFNSEDGRVTIVPPEDPKMPEQASGPVQAIVAEQDLSEDIDPEFEDDLEKALGVDTFEPVLSTDGIRGEAVLLRGGEATLPLPAGVDFTDGTVEFWIRPGNWDNLTVAPGRHATFGYRQSSMHLMTLYGVPRKGDGEPIPLASARASRLQGKLPVFEAFAKYYPNDPEYLIMPHHWTHVVFYWGKKLKHYQPGLCFDGHHVGWDLRTKLAKKAEWEIWDTHRPAFIKFGNNMETSFDELRVCNYPFIPQEIGNSIAQAKGEAMEKVGAATVSYEYRLSIGKMVLTAALSLLDAEAAAIAEVEFELPHENRKVSGTIDDLSGATGSVMLDVGTLPEGDYPVRGVVKDKNGKQLGAFASTFTREPVPWLNNRIGILDSPPSPFEPVMVEGTSVRSVLRRHDLSDDGNFRQITVKEKEVLASPIRFEVEIDGKTHILSPSGKVSFGEANKVEAHWSGKAMSNGLTIQSDAQFEYDGMAKYEIQIVPDGQVTVDRLSLIIPMKKEFSELFHVLPVGGNMRGYETSGYLPFEQGLVWDSKTWSAKMPVTKMKIGNFISMVWLGGPVRGLTWFADNDQGWVPNNDRPALTLTRTGEEVHLGVHFICEKFTLTEPRKIVYGFMATPPKPLAKDYRAWGRGNLKKHGPVAGRITSCDSFAPWEVPCRDGAFDYWPLGYDWEFAKLASDQQRVSKHGKYQPGQALMLYHDKRFVPHGKDAQYFHWEWTTNKQGAWPQSKIDCLIWYMDRWFGRHIMDGIYIDDTFPIADFNWATGSAYKLPDGQVQPGATNFTYRRYLKRMYSVFHIHGKPPIMTSHMSTTMVWPFHSFFNVIYDGEAVGNFGSLTTTFLDAWPLDRLMTINIPERTGLVTRVMIKSEYADRGLNQEAWAHMIWRTYRSAAAAWLLFDMNMKVNELAAVLEPYYDEDVTVLPFWTNENVVRIDPLPVTVTDEKLLPKRGRWRNRVFRASIGKQPFRTTIFKKPGKALVVTVNFLKATKSAVVRLDLDTLGVPKDKQQGITATDIDTWTEPEGIDIQRTAKPTLDDSNVAISPEDSVDTEKVSVEEDLGLKKEEPDYVYKNGVLTVKVKDHNFRLIQLNW